jgi:hypothetical protein
VAQLSAYNNDDVMRKAALDRFWILYLGSLAFVKSSVDDNSFGSEHSGDSLPIKAVMVNICENYIGFIDPSTGKFDNGRDARVICHPPDQTLAHEAINLSRRAKEETKQPVGSIGFGDLNK